MDEIFHKSTSVFDVVRLARPSVTPNRYGKNGELLVNYLESDEHRRRSSVAGGATETAMEKARADAVENKPRAEHDEGYRAEGGYAGGSGTSSEKFD